MPICLYCKQENRTFSSVEHVIPESLGNVGGGNRRAVVLPKGVVCDRCNNGKLAELDQTLINFAPISLMKTMHGIRSKSGKLPKSTFGNMSLAMFAPGNVVFDLNSKKSFEPTEEGFKLHGVGSHRLTPNYVRKITRAIFKMTLGCMHIDHGSELTLQERFDRVRRMILGLDKFHGYLAIVKNIEEPWKQVSGLTYQFLEVDGKSTVGAQFQFYGVTLATDLEVRKLKYPEAVPKDLIDVIEF